MNSAREERPHRLPDEVRRRDAVDPEPVRDLDRDRRFAGSRRASDQDDHRHIELLEIRQPSEPPDGPFALLVAEHLACEHVEPLEVAADGPLGEIDLDPPRELVGAIGRHAGRDQGARHQPLRIRQVASPSGSGSPWRAGSRDTFAGASDASASSTPSTDELVRGQHDAPVLRERMLGDNVDRRRLHLDQVGVGVEPASSSAQGGRGRRGSPRRGRCRRRDERRRSHPQ